MKTPRPQLHYHDPLNTLELVACQLANILGIVVGIGAIPLLRVQLVNWYWIGGVVGALVVAVGLLFLERRAHRLAPSLRRLLTLLRQLPGFLHRVLNWIRLHLLKRHQTASGPPEAPAAKESLTTAARSALTSTTSGIPSPIRQLVLLPYLTLLIGLFIIFPAVLVICLHYFWGSNAAQQDALEQVAIYFSTPALLIWVIGEISYILPKIVVIPWDGSVITGLFKSGLQALSAALIWVYLALALIDKEQLWLLLGGVALALVGLVFGFISEVIERQRIRIRSQNSNLVRRRETAR